jgi:AraC-like DNA-binding protein
MPSDASHGTQRLEKARKAVGLKLDKQAASIFGIKADKLPFRGYCLYSGPDFDQASRGVGKISDSRTLTPLEDTPTPYIEVHRAKLQYSQIVVTYNNVRTRLTTKHPTSYYSLIIPLKGSHTIKYVNDKIRVVPGEASFASANQLFDATRSKDYIALIASLSINGFEHFFGNDIFSSQSERAPFNYLIDLRDKRYDSLTSILALICTELDSPPSDFPWCDTVIERLEEVFWIKLMDAIPNLASYIEQEPKKTILPGYIKRTTSYIENHLDTDLQLSELVKISKTSQRTLQKGFKDIYGVGPKNYIRQKKLHKVRQDLLNPETEELFVGDIAANWGFFHLSNFSKYYRQVFGELPSDTLKKVQESKIQNENKK